MVRSPSIIGDVWFNTKPLTPKNLEGKIVLIDFWTYSCVNCLRTLPYLKEWWGKYRGLGLMIVGIHTPEFESEKDPRNVKEAIRGLGIEWPVVLDNRKENWHNFANRYWPAKYLVDPKKNINYIYFGEGNYAQTEAAIQKELKKIHPEAAFPEIKKEARKKAGLCFIPTPELYCGYQGGVLSNYEGYEPEKVYDYKLPEKLREDSIALDGKFIAAPEYVESAEKGSRLLVRFRATEVNLVLSPAGKSAKVKALLDDKELEPEKKGRDLTESSRLNVEEPRMYNILKNPSIVEGTLSIEADSGSFKAFAFTFSGCN